MAPCAASYRDEYTQYFCTLDAGHPANPDGETITHRSTWLGPDPANPISIPWTYEYHQEWTVPVEPET